MTKRTGLTLLLAAAALLAPAGTAGAAPGDDDLTFSEDGAFYELFEPSERPNLIVGNVHVARGPDGDLYLASQAYRYGTEAPDSEVELRVVRLNPDGTPDPQFGGDGRVSRFYETWNVPEILDLEVLADGTVVVLATDDVDVSSNPTVVEQRFLVLWLDGAGASVTPGGDGDGFVRESDPICPGSPELGRVLPSGGVAIVWHGCHTVDDKDPDAIGRARHQRYEFQGGDLVPRYKGPQVLPMPNGTDEVIPRDMVIEADGDAAMLGSVFEHGGEAVRGDAPTAVVARYDVEDGALVESWGGGGAVEFPGAYPGSLGRRPAGGLLVALDAERDAWTFVHVDGSGAVDQPFRGADQGAVRVSHPDLHGGFPLSVHEQADGRFYGFRGEPTKGDDGAPVVARFTADGALDPTFSGDGVRVLDVAGTDMRGGGPLIVDPQGRPVLPFNAQVFTPSGRLDPPPRDGQYLAAVRLQNEPIASQPPPAQSVPPAVLPPASAGTPAPVPQVAASRRACASRRSFRIRLRTGRRKAEQSRIVSADVRVNGRRVSIQRGGRVRSTVSLRNLPAGRFTVRIRLRLADGGRVRETRRYRTCTRKIERELPPLRTRPPRR